MKLRSLGVVLALLVLAGCSSPMRQERPAAGSAAAPSSAAAGGGRTEVGKGTVPGPVTISTQGPSDFSVQTAVLPPGGSTGWHSHPGSELSIVKSGSITLIQAGECRPMTIGAGQAVFIPAGTAHLARNDGAGPAELVVTYLLDPGNPTRSDVAPAPCAGA